MKKGNLEIDFFNYYIIFLFNIRVQFSIDTKQTWYVIEHLVKLYYPETMVLKNKNNSFLIMLRIKN